MSSANIQLLKSLLTDNNLSYTKSRELVFKALSKNNPQSINEIITQLNGRVDRVSVYRNIELFESLGIIHRVNVGWKYKLELSDRFSAHHHHLSCIGCGRILDIEDERHINNFIYEVSNRFAFVPVRHQFEIEGWCQACEAKRQLASDESSA